MASYPSYDPNIAATSHGARNLPVTDAFEAGSVMKVFSVATALDAGVVTPDTEFQIGNSFSVGKRADHRPRVRRVSDRHRHHQALVEHRRREDRAAARQREALRRAPQFGFGGKTGIELPGEQIGMLRNGKNWRDIDLAHIAFGYGLTVTPLQLAAALATIGNHGIYEEPRIVDQVTDVDGNVMYHGEGEEHRAVSRDDGRRDDEDARGGVRQGRQRQGRRHREGSRRPGFKCAGKTGTAYKFDPVTHSYGNHDHYMSSFAGLAPAEHPRLAIVVQIDDPTGADHYGGSVAGPVFAKDRERGLRYLGVPGARRHRRRSCPEAAAKPVKKAAPTPVAAGSSPSSMQTSRSSPRSRFPTSPGWA